MVVVKRLVCIVWRIVRSFEVDFSIESSVLQIIEPPDEPVKVWRNPDRGLVYIELKIRTRLEQSRLNHTKISKFNLASATSIEKSKEGSGSNKEDEEDKEKTKR